MQWANVACVEQRETHIVAGSADVEVATYAVGHRDRAVFGQLVLFDEGRRLFWGILAEDIDYIALEIVNSNIMFSNKNNFTRFSNLMKDFCHLYPLAKIKKGTRFID